MSVLLQLIVVMTLAGCALMACYKLSYGWTMVFTILLLILTARAEATPIMLEDEPCQEKVLITRKATPRASPAKPSPIIAWVTVRSGRPSSPETTCTDETLVLDLPDPLLVGFEPEAGYTPFVEQEEPEPIEWTPYWPRWYWWNDIPRWVIVRVPPRGDRPPEDDEEPPPPVSVPEPATWALMSLGLLGLAIRRRAA